MKALIFWSRANGVKGLTSPGTTSGVMGTTSVNIHGNLTNQSRQLPGSDGKSKASSIHSTKAS